MRKVLVALSALFVVVAGTGVNQAFRYFPRGSQWVGDVHEWSSYALIVVTLVALAMWLSWRVTLGWPGAVMLAIALVAALVGFFTGGAISWDQFALNAVGSPRGVFDLAHVQFVIVGGRVLGPDTFRRTVIVHTIVVSVVFAVTLGGASWFARSKARVRSAELEETPS